MKCLLLHLYAMVLRGVSWIAPGEEREAWRKEWVAELWHVAKTNAGRTTAAFVAGAFQDAYALRRDLQPEGRPRAHTIASSPVACLLLLLAASLASISIAFLLPGARAALLPAPYSDARSLVVVSRDGASHTQGPTITLDEFRYWQRAAQNVFSDLAFYQVVRKELHTGHGAGVEISIVRGSDELLSVLQAADFPTVGRTANDMSPRLILSRAVWRKYFHADPHIVGRALFLMGEKATIIGVVPADTWRLPGKADVWLLENDGRTESFVPSVMGYVAARMQPSFLRDTSENRWHMSVPQKSGDIDGFDCVSVNRYDREPFVLFAFAALLALLALPATTSLPLGEYPYNPRQQSLSLRLRRWLFFTAKLILIVPLICFASLDIAQLFADTQSVQLFVTFAGMLASLRWVLRDQRRRCPVCLEFLRHPVHVGQPSRNFLAWNGTELICVVGHGFLHVPELPTSWFATQRWLYLDASWRSLFRPGVAPTS